MSAVFIAQKPGTADDITKNYGRYPNETDFMYLDRIQRTEADHYYNASLAITTALSCTVFFSARDVIMRYYKDKKKYPAFELALDSLTLYSFSCTVFAIYIFNFDNYDFDWGSFSAGCMSAVLNTLGFMMLGISVVIGYAGPANALNSIQAVVLTFLSIMIMNQIPTHMQVIGMLLGIIGTIIVSIGDAIMKSVKDCIKNVREMRNEESFNEESRTGDYEKMRN